jgi:hypothetical protein
MGALQTTFVRWGWRFRLRIVWPFVVSNSGVTLTIHLRYGLVRSHCKKSGKIVTSEPGVMEDDLFYLLTFTKLAIRKTRDQ